MTTLSHTRGATGLPLLEETIFDRTVAIHGDRDALLEHAPAGAGPTPTSGPMSTRSRTA